MKSTSDPTTTPESQLIANPETSPLAEATPSSLSELFSRDPLKLGTQDFALVIEEYRRARANWKLAEAQGKRSAPREKKPDLKLEDLEL